METILTNGYPKEIFREGFDTKFLCNHCGRILREPVQSFCGHRFCKACIESVVRNNTNVQCKTCMDEGTTDDYSILRVDQMFPDNAVRREMASMETHCMFPDCSWMGSFKQFERHIHECPFKPTTCPDCGSVVNSVILQQHQDQQCPNRKTSCKHCGEQLVFAKIKEHNETCSKYPMKCPTCKIKKIPREQFQLHVERQCPEQEVNCPVCSGRFKRQDFGRHVKDDMSSHLLWIIEQIYILQQTIAGSINASSPLTDVNQISHRITELEQKVQEHVQVLQTVATVTGQTNNNTGSISHEDLEPVRGRIQALELKTSTFEGIVTTLHRELERCLSAIEAGERQRQVDKEIIENTEKKIKNLERQLALKDVVLAEQDLRIQSVELASYDGSLLWKISDFQKKRVEAIKGKTTSLYSPVFYTSRTGYKMCARLYPNGDGMGKGTHVSLFFVIMRGHYDNILIWPFQERVTFMMLDQNGKDHVVDSFRPDPTSSSFKKPGSEMNIASGCPLLLPLAKLEDRSRYIKDDTMFIKVLVDCSNIKKT